MYLCVYTNACSILMLILLTLAVSSFVESNINQVKEIKSTFGLPPSLLHTFVYVSLAIPYTLFFPLVILPSVALLSLNLSLNCNMGLAYGQEGLQRNGVVLRNSRKRIVRGCLVMSLVRSLVRRLVRLILTTLNEG